MKLNDLISANEQFRRTTTALKKYSMANMFDVVNKGSLSYFNLCKRLSFNIEDIDDSYFNYYILKDTDTWTAISYKFYETPELWWLICKFNNVQNPFSEIVAGKEIKVPTKEVVESILHIIRHN